MSEWKEDKLGNLAEVQTGPFGSQLKNEQYITGGTPVVTVEHIKDFLIEDFTYPSVTDEDKNTLKRYILKSGDIVFSRVGSVDLSALVKEHQDGWLFSSRMLRVRVKEKLNTQFLSYYLRQSTIRQFILNISVGSTMPSINTEILKSLPIVYCSLKEQKQIADILSCLDNKIDNLRRQNETLEKIAQTLFKHWFIDFEFPNDDGKPYKSSGGAMVASELGDIPEGWRVGKLGDIVNIKHGFPFQGEYITDEETKHILLTPVNFKIGGGFNDSKYKYYSTDNYSESFILNKNDLIVTMTDLSKAGDTLGYPAFVPEVKGKILLHNQMLGKVETDLINKPFLYFLMCRREYRLYILGTASGSTVRHTSPTRINDYKFILPELSILKQFSSIAKVIIDKQLENFNKIQILTETRDILLPKLMSGKIRIKSVGEEK